MDQANEAQEHEQDEGQHEEIVAGLVAQDQPGATHKPEEKKEGAGTGGATPGGVSGDVHASTETGAQGGGTEHQPQTQQAPTQIDTAKATANTKAWNQRENSRKKEQTARIEARVGPKKGAWTATELATCQSNGGAMGVLIALNERQPKQGVQILKDANKWDLLVASLPKGKLTAPAAKAVDLMVQDSVFALADMITLFEKRFAHPALGVSSGANNAKDWTHDSMIVIWRQLALLPASDVTLNSAIASFRAISGGGAFGPAWDSPTVNTVDMGQDNGNHEHLEHTTRHEIGHGVHSQIQGQVNPWLQNDMKFWYITFDEFITDLGGFPATYTKANGSVVPMDANMKAWMSHLVKEFTGYGAWGPTKATPETGAHPDVAAAWASMPLAIRNACTQSKSHWYKNYENFQESGGNSYFLNHYYKKPFKFGATAKAAISATNDNYTAMSEKEFFANCYAEYFANPAGAKIHAQWGGALPGSVKAFFKDCVVERNPYSAFQKSQAKKETA